MVLASEILNELFRSKVPSNFNFQNLIEDLKILTLWIKFFKQLDIKNLGVSSKSFKNCRINRSTSRINFNVPQR